MTVELGLRRLSFQRQHEIDISYKGHVISTARLDLLVADQLVVELKAVDSISSLHVAQTLSYLTGLGLELGLILNFNVGLMKNGIRRVIRDLDPENAFVSS
jgi:GxxExxY protein